MADTTPATLGEVSLPIEDGSARLFLHQQVASGTIEETGEEITVSITMGGFPALQVSIGTKRYLVELRPAVDAVVEIHHAEVRS